MNQLKMAYEKEVEEPLLWFMLSRYVHASYT